MLFRSEWLPVLDLLVLDDANPRSLRCAAEGVLGYVHKLEKGLGPCGSEILVPHVAALAALDAGTDLRPDSAHLIGVLGNLRAAAFALGDHLSTRFFNLSDARNRAQLAS